MFIIDTLTKIAEDAHILIVENTRLNCVIYKLKNLNWQIV